MSIDDEDEKRSSQQRTFTVLYGSQTGNAQDVASRIARQARRRRIQVVVKSMDEYDVVSLVVLSRRPYCPVL